MQDVLPLATHTHTRWHSVRVTVVIPPTWTGRQVFRAGLLLVWQRARANTLTLPVYLPRHTACTHFCRAQALPVSRALPHQQLTPLPPTLPPRAAAWDWTSRIYAFLNKLQRPPPPILALQRAFVRATLLRISLVNMLALFSCRCTRLRRLRGRNMRASLSLTAV